MQTNIWIVIDKIHYELSPLIVITVLCLLCAFRSNPISFVMKFSKKKYRICIANPVFFMFDNNSQFGGCWNRILLSKTLCNNSFWWFMSDISGAHTVGKCVEWNFKDFFVFIFSHNRHICFIMAPRFVGFNCWSFENHSWRQI